MQKTPRWFNVLQFLTVKFLVSLATFLAIWLCLTSCGEIGIQLPNDFSRLSSSLVESQAAPGSVLFQDDFSNPASGWDRFADGQSRLDYEDDTYRFSIQRPAWYYLSTPHLEFSDVEVRVEANRVAGDGVSVMGVICRYQDEGNFYLFTLTSDGYYGISKFEDGREYLIGTEVLVSHPGVHTGNATNAITVECQGQNLGLAVNGNGLIRARDEAYSSGAVGLAGAILSGSAAILEFDNFSVLKH